MEKAWYSFFWHAYRHGRYVKDVTARYKRFESDTAAGRWCAKANTRLGWKEHQINPIGGHVDSEHVNGTCCTVGFTGPWSYDPTPRRRRRKLETIVSDTSAATKARLCNRCRFSSVCAENRKRTGKIGYRLVWQFARPNVQSLNLTAVYRQFAHCKDAIEAVVQCNMAFGFNRAELTKSTFGNGSPPLMTARDREYVVLYGPTFSPRVKAQTGPIG